MVTKLVKNIAKEMAGAFYDGQDMFHDGRVERSALFRIQAVTQHQFVATYWKDFVVMARQSLAMMLTEEGRSQADKDKIYDALLMERGAVTDAMQVAPSIMGIH